MRAPDDAGSGDAGVTMSRLIPFLVLALLPAPALAQGGAATSDRGLLMRIDGNVNVAAGERAGAVVVINGDAHIAGAGRNVVVIRGNLTVSGTVEEDIFTVNSDVELQSGAVVRGDVTLAGGSLSRAAGVTVEGTVEDDIGLNIGWVLGVFSVLF